MRIVDMETLRRSMAFGLQGMAVLLMLSAVCAVHPLLPAGETIGQWVCFDRALAVGALLVLLSLPLAGSRGCLLFPDALSVALMFWGGVEAVWGLRQLYGFSASGHSLYALTGSFFNPGPYSGFLALVLPLCLHYALSGKRWFRLPSVGVALLVCLVLPAGMSRSAWLAAGFSCLWVYGCHKDGWHRVRQLWSRYRHRMLAWSVAGCVVLLFACCLLFHLKPDSARGRLFLWRMTCRAIAGQPFSGYGTDGFASAYGAAQESYFASGDYAPWEERVAGSPEYAFNEYLQTAVEWGVPVAVILLVAVLLSWYVGMKRHRVGICGALLSLLIFAFSSYPLQLPVFVVALCGLLVACWAGRNRRSWLMVALVAGLTGTLRLPDDRKTMQACREWTNARVLYQSGAYRLAGDAYGRLYPLLRGRAAFLFEYGHALHRQGRLEESDRILQEALQRSCDPMILNILGKNSWQQGEYQAAEAWLLRSVHRLPGRIYPYYLLAKFYADPNYCQPDKLEEMRRLVLTKEPKVHSRAIEEMREEVKALPPDDAAGRTE